MLSGSIVRRHNHANAIKFIGLSFEGTSFPAVLTCPFCGENALYAFDYLVREDVWFNCTACSSHGNIITLAAQIWKTDIPDAIDKLIDSGLTIGRNINDVAAIVKLNSKQKLAELFWATAVDQAWTHADDTILHRYREIGISTEIPCTGLIGVATGQQAVDFCKSIYRAWPKHIRYTVPVNILPYYDLPNHFTGFLLLQSDKNMETRQAFIPINTANPSKTDAGYYMLDHALLPAKPPVKDALFIADDPLWAIQAHTVQLRHDSPPLPICASYVGKEALSYGLCFHNFKQTKKLFYGSSITPELVSQAANAKGYVCVPGPDNAPMHPSPLRTMHRLSKIYKSAQTWQTVLENELKNLELTAAISFASKLSIAREKLQHFLKARTQFPETTIVEILGRATPYTTAEVGRLGAANDVVERDDGWYTSSGLCITTCLPRITQIVYTQDGKKYYAGYVKKKDVVIEFFESAKQIEKIGLLIYVEQLLAGQGILVVSTSRWNKRAVTVSLSLHPPTVLTVSDTLGWDDAAREFRFSTYSISNEGAILPLACPQLQTNKQFDFPEPTTAAPPAIKELLTPAYENAFVWEFTAAILTNFIAPIMGVPTTAVAITKNAYDAAIAIGRALGCDIRNLDTRTNSINSRLGVELKSISGNTMMVNNSKPDFELRYLVMKSPQYPLFIGIDDASLAGVLSFNWAAIAPTAVPAANTNYDVLKYIVPAYIQHTLRQRVGFIGAGSDLLLAVLRDLHAWLENTHGESFNLNAAESQILTPKITHEVFMRELNNALCAGHIDMLPRHRLGRQSQNYVLRTSEHWWLNKRIIKEYLVKNGIAPNWTALLNCLTQQGVFCGEEFLNGHHWFLIDKSWCDKFWSDYAEKDVG